MSALAAAKETGRGAPFVIIVACLAQPSASSLRTIPWWPGIQSRVVFPAHFLLSTEPLWISLRSNGLSVQVAAATCDDESLSSAMRIATSSSSYDEVIAAPRCCFVKVRGVGRVSFCYHHSRDTIQYPCCCRVIGVDDESGIQVSGDSQVDGGVILGARSCAVVGVYSSVA